jgi:hypothetical protein
MERGDARRLDQHQRKARKELFRLGAHGYYRKDGPAIAAIIGFIC